MEIPVFIDSCAWNELFKRSVKLEEELPETAFSLHLTREVAIEIGAMRTKPEKQELLAYVDRSISNSGIRTRGTFGFHTSEPDGTPSKAQVYVGFNQGNFQSKHDRGWYARDEVKKLTLHKGKREKTGLGKNQTDASLAVRSFHSVILTAEAPNKSGPLRLAHSEGGRIIYFSEIDQSGLSLGEYIKRAWTDSMPTTAQP
jgi:hypothetical protein